MKNIASTLFLLLLFVPLIAAASRQDETAELASKPAEQASITLPELIYDSSKHFSSIDSANLDGLLERIGNSRLVLMGEVARWRHGCLMPWANDPSHYSSDMQSGRYRGCEYEVFAVCRDLRKKRAFYSEADREVDRQHYFSAEQNARLVRNAERYYRTMSGARNDSWNQRDQNMLETLLAILDYRGQTSKAVVWAHNSHIGDARATDMRLRGQLNLGQLARETFGDDAYLIGFGTDHGMVAAASEWGGAMKVMQVRPSHANSYEHLFHDVKADNFLLPLRNPIQDITRIKLLEKRLQRAIGKTYDPEDELKKALFANRVGDSCGEPPVVDTGC